MIFESVQKMGNVMTILVANSKYNCIAYGINRCSDNLSGRLTITGNMSTFTGKVKNRLLNIVNVVREF